jgi:hypothetical protein
MIDRRHLRKGLEVALRFANAPAPPANGERKTISIPYLSFDMEPPHHEYEVDAGDLQLWEEWRDWLRKFRRRGKRVAWRQWCHKELQPSCMKWGRGHVELFAQPTEVPFSFDAAGAPQAHLFPKSLQGLLAVVGAELIAPAPPFTVAKCAREGCPNLIVEVRIRHRSDGRPTEYCKLPNGTSHALTARERQTKYKIEQRKKRKRTRQ